ncbi:hypothetical protein LJC33_07390 [Eubacteriales bacterium OttesenSCG-928-N13]|nr:hypothetical protein [Eubacteriales bacterium OttesenSCG-928-N13]
MHDETVLLKQHMARYPLSEPQDLVKLCYQMEMGGGHLISNRAQSLARLEAECASLDPHNVPPMRFEPIGSDLVRLHLGGLSLSPSGDGQVSLSTINAAFAHSSAAVQGSIDGLEQRLSQLSAISDAPFSPDALARYLNEYRAQGHPMVSHSEAYRSAYHPAYRVVLARFEALWPLLARIDSLRRTQPQVLIAIDGNSGAGKSTLGALLQDVYGASLLHMDDFFLSPERKTPERLAQPGGNVDHERFLREVLIPLQSGEAFRYRPYDCQTGKLSDWVDVPPSPVRIVEGVYSLHPSLSAAYDVKVFLSLPFDVQSERILKRSGPYLHQRFIHEWIPLENHYFDALSIASGCDYRL